MRAAIRQVLFSSPKFLLDRISGVSAIYSLRKISKVQNLCLRIRRASDNAEVDIGFDRVNKLDKSTIANFAPIEQTFVVAWYGGGGQSIQQVTASKQPELIWNTTDPYVKFTNDSLLRGGAPFGLTNSDNFGFLFKLTEGTRTSATLFSLTDDPSQLFIGQHPWSDGITYLTIGQASNPSNRVSAPLPVSIGTEHIAEFTNSDNNNLFAIYINGSVLISAANGLAVISPTKFAIGREPFLDVFTGQSFTGNIKTALLFTRQLSDSERIIINNII
jgi:hypothetical protein